jgi:hypothetical protein
MAPVPHRKLKVAALVLLGLPAAVLVLFLAGETVGGDATGLQHLVQLAPLAILGGVAWRYPRAGGLALIVIGLVLAVLYPWVFGGFPLSTVVLVEMLLFAPPIVAGLLFVAAGTHER